MTRKALADAIRAQNTGNEPPCTSNEMPCTSNETPVENESPCSSSRSSFSSTPESTSASSSTSEQVDNYFWPNLEKHHRNKCYPEKYLDIFFFDSSPESTKCFSELYSPWEKEEKIMSKESIQVSNDMCVSLEEFHNLLVEKLDKLHLD